jgi:hypothetical protein
LYDVSKTPALHEPLVTQRGVRSILPQDFRLLFPSQRALPKKREKEKEKRKKDLGVSSRM